MMVCPYCSHEIETNTSVCPVCGKTFPPPAGSPAYEGAQKKEPPAAPSPAMPPQAGFTPPNPIQPNQSPFAAAPGQPYAQPFEPMQPNYRSQPAYPGVEYNREPQESRTAQTLGILGLILNTFFSFTLIGGILSLAGIIKSGSARKLTGGAFSPSAKVGRVCGIIGLILAVLRILLAVGILLVVLFLFDGLTGLYDRLPEIFNSLPYEVEEYLDNFMRIGMFL